MSVAISGLSSDCGVTVSTIPFRYGRSVLASRLSLFHLKGQSSLNLPLKDLWLDYLARRICPLSQPLGAGRGEHWVGWGSGWRSDSWAGLEEAVIS